MEFVSARDTGWFCACRLGRGELVDETAPRVVVGEVGAEEALVAATSAIASPSSHRTVLPIPASPDSTRAAGPRSTAPRNARIAPSASFRPITLATAMNSG